MIKINGITKAFLLLVVFSFTILSCVPRPEKCDDPTYSIDIVSEALNIRKSLFDSDTVLYGNVGELMDSTEIANGHFDFPIDEQWVYFPNNVDDLINDLESENARILLCPCNDFPMVMSNIMIGYEPRRPARKEGDISYTGGNIPPVRNHLLVDESMTFFNPANTEDKGFQQVDFDSLLLKTDNCTSDFPSLISENTGYKIAILDTGIDTDVFKDYLWSPGQDAYITANLGEFDTNMPTIKGGISMIPADELFPYFQDDILEFYETPSDVDQKKISTGTGNGGSVNFQGHGTYVAGIINKYAKNDEFMIIRTHDKSGNSTLFHTLCALNYAKENGAKFINTSWGFYSTEYMIDSLYMEFAMTAKIEGISMFSSLGNLGVNVDFVRHYPSQLKKDGFDNVFDVAAYGRNWLNVPQFGQMQNRSLAPYSNFSCDERTYSMPGRIQFCNGIVIKGTSFATPQLLGIEYRKFVEDRFGWKENNKRSNMTKHPLKIQ